MDINGAPDEEDILQGTTGVGDERIVIQLETSYHACQISAISVILMIPSVSVLPQASSCTIETSPDWSRWSTHGMGSLPTGVACDRVGQEKDYLPGRKYRSGGSKQIDATVSLSIYRLEVPHQAIPALGESIQYMLGDSPTTRNSRACPSMSISLAVVGNAV